MRKIIVLQSPSLNLQRRHAGQVLSEGLDLQFGRLGAGAAGLFALLTRGTKVPPRGTAVTAVEGATGWPCESTHILDHFMSSPSGGNRDRFGRDFTNPRFPSEIAPFRLQRLQITPHEHVLRVIGYWHMPPGHYIGWSG